MAAWRGLDEGPVLDELCHSFGGTEAERQGAAGRFAGDHQEPESGRPPASRPASSATTTISKARAGSFPQVCTTHTYEERVQTIRHLKQAGIKICSGGILGMGETRADRCDLAFSLKELGAHVVPINILNPIEGTPFGERGPLPPLEILKSIACFRFILPRQEIMIAGGRTVNLRDLQSLIFMAGASALMVGNYSTTLNQPVEKDLQMLKDLGLDPSWDKHGFADQPRQPAAVP